MERAPGHREGRFFPCAMGPGPCAFPAACYFSESVETAESDPPSICSACSRVSPTRAGSPESMAAASVSTRVVSWKENVIIGKLIPAGSGLSRYRNVQVRIKPEAIPEYWLARQRELQDAVEGGTGEPALVGLTREQAEAMLGGKVGVTDE